MIIHDLDLVGVPITPDETNPPLVIDANAVLSGPVSRQRFQPVAGWHTQILQRPRTVQVFELAPRRVLNVGWQPPRMLTPKNPRRLRIGEANDHNGILSR